jgi:uncharacterized protein YjiS (DUF1127 family)
MGMEKRASDNRPLLALLIGPARRFCERMIDRRRRRIGAQQLAELNDHLLCDIGLTRSQAYAAAYGLLELREPAAPRRMEASPPTDAGNVVPLKQRAIAVRVDQATSAPLVKRVANG